MYICYFFLNRKFIFGSLLIVVLPFFLSCFFTNFGRGGVDVETYKCNLDNTKSDITLCLLLVQLIRAHCFSLLVYWGSVVNNPV